MSTSPKRRWLLIAALLVLVMATGAILWRSKRPGPASDSRSMPSGDCRTAKRSIWDVWAALREAVRQSPDHLVARADRLVAALRTEPASEAAAQALLRLVCPWTAAAS